MIGLYINWDFDSEIINIYGFPLKYYGLLFGGGLLLSTYILKGIYKRENLKDLLPDLNSYKILETIFYEYFHLDETKEPMYKMKKDLFSNIVKK